MSVQDLIKLLKIARGRNIGTWLLVSKLVTKPLYFYRAPFQRKPLVTCGIFF